MQSAGRFADWDSGPAGGPPVTLYDPASLDEAHDHHDQRDHQQQVNEAAEVQDGEAQQPEDQQDDDDCPKHLFSFLFQQDGKALARPPCPRKD